MATPCRGSTCTAKYRASRNGLIEISGMVDFSDARRPKFIQTTWLEGEEIMIEIRKTITLRETVFSPERRREFARDSLLEEDGFEPSVPRDLGSRRVSLDTR